MKRKLLSVLLVLVLALSLSLVTAVPVAAAPVTQTVISDGDDSTVPLSEMDQQFSTETVDASGGVTLSGSVTLGGFNDGAGDDVWYEAGLVSNETYLGYSRLHNKGVYMIALWTGTGYIVHMQNVVGQQPQNTGNYLGDEVAYTDLWGDAGKGYFQVPSASFDYEIKYHNVTASGGNVDLRISVDGGTNWSGWKLYKYAETDMEDIYPLTPEQAVEYGYAADDNLTNARIVSQIFVCSGTTETFTAAYDNIQIDGTPYTLSPRVLNVDTNKGYASIQLAIDDAQLNETITVAMGTYNEDITLKNGVQVLGAGEASTTINGTGTGSVVIASGVGPATKLDGFTITGGNTTTSGGGGMYIVNSSLMVTNCTFSGNTASVAGQPAGLGGGMHNVNSSPTITNCTFSGNWSNQGGGGMCNSGSSSPTVTNCTFFDNSTKFGGGGMSNEESSSTVVTDCTFYNNSTQYGGGGMENYWSSATVTNCTFYSNTSQDGGGMNNHNSSSEVTNCIFYGNTASSWGGGMYNYGSSPTVTNCTFSGNWAYYYGGAIASVFNSTATLTNCILWGDSVQVHEGPEIFDWVLTDDPSITTVTYSDVQGGWPGTGNKNIYPRFENAAAGDYHLMAGSPCIDAGNNAAVPPGVTTDFEGDPRIIGAVVDMGADESRPHEVWVDATGSDTNPGTEALPFATIQQGINNVAPGGTVNVLTGTYDEQVEIAQSLTLQGAGDTAVIQPSGPGLMATTSIPWIGGGTGTMAAIVSVETTGDEVTIKDLKIDGSLITNKSTTWVAGLVYLETSGTVDVTVIGNPTLPDRTAGIFAAAITESASLEITGCTVIGYNRAGIYALGGEFTADYHHNEINGPGSIATGVPNGMFFLEGAKGSATYNTVTDLGYTGEGEYRSTGIGTYNAGTDVTFAYNIISNVQNAFALSTGTIGTIVENNDIYNCHTGVRIEADAASSIIQYNDIHDNDFAIRCGAAMGDGNEAHYNNFVGNPGVLWVNEDEAVPNTYVGAVCNVHETYTLDATLNWWGDASGPSGEGTGSGDAVSSNVDFTPWLDAEYYPVEINGVGYDTIQDAVDAASPGDTITVRPGEYTMDITINEDVTLVSSGGSEVTKLTGTGLNPVVTIGDYTVTIDGFEIDPGTDGIYIPLISAGNVVTIQNAVIHGNADDGIEVGTVYGTLNILDNVIAENDYGVYLPEVDEGGIVNIKGNAIGAWQDADYNLSGNYYGGILIDYIYDGSTVTIGGATEAEANFICENGDEGIYVDELYHGSTLTIEGNAIGAFAHDGYTFNGNGDEGIYIDGVDYGSTVTIGGATEAEANFICENGDEGIEIYEVGFDDSSFTVDEYYALYQTYGANYVTIEGNTITDNNVHGLYISYVNFASYITIEDNVVSGNVDDGIALEYFGQYGYDYYLDDDTTSVHQDPDYPDYFGPVVLIQGNTITDNEDDGIYQYDDWEYGTSVTIEDNVITGNLDAGIYHYYDVMNDAHVIIRGNTIASNGFNGGIYWSSDAYIDYASSYTVENNLIAGNGDDGMYIYGVCDDSTLTIRGNTIGAGADAQGSQYPANDGYGIYIEYVDYYSTAEISGNTISGNSDDGIDIEYVYEYGSANITSNIITENDDGIYIDEVYDDGSVSITHNDILDNNGLGIDIEYVSEYGTAEISGNTISGHSSDGIYIGEVYDDGSVSITSNDILDNGYGIEIYDVYVSSTAGSLEAHYNNIVGNSSYGVYSSSDEYVDASNNWWGDATGPKQATTNPCASGDEASDNVGYTPWLDATYPGGSERTYNVENTDTFDTFNSIQVAIDAAAEGNTISVAAGTYVEDLAIPDTKTNLELAGATGATIKGMALSEWGVTTLPNIEILADGVSIHGFTIQGPEPSGTLFAAGMIIGAKDVEIYNNAFEVNNASDTTNADDVCQGIVAYNQLAIPGVDISGLSIHNNTFTHRGTGTIGYEGIYINRDAGTGTITIADNVFTGAIIRGITVERSNATISGNSLIPTVTSWAWTGVLVMDIGSGEAQDSISITGNTTEGFVNGIKLGDSGGLQTLTNISITSNTLQGNDTGILVRSSADGVVVNYNNIDGNTTGVDNIDTATLDATNNWWGDMTGPQHATLNSEGQGNAVSDNVSFDPWLLKWYSTEPAPAPPPPPPPTIDTELFDTEASFETNSDGEIQETIEATSEDENVTITIEAGTIALDAEGKPLSTLTAAVEPSPPEPPEDTYLIGAYDFGPDGATFDPPLTLTWIYDPETLPEDVDLVIAYYDEVNEEWVWVPCEVDTENNIITASVAHFTTFTIIAVPAELPPAPAAFTVSSLGVSPSELAPGEEVNISVLVSNTGGKSGSYSVVLKINGVKEAEERVTIAAGRSQTVTFSVTKEEADTYAVTVDGLIGSFTVVSVVVPPEPAAFSVSRLSFQPAEVEAATAVTIAVLVSNTGGTEGSYTVVLKVNGVKEAEKTVTIAAGESEEVSFSVTREEAGSYTVDVDGLSGSFTVVLPIKPPGINWPLIGGIIGGVIVAGLLYYFLVFRRRAY